MITNCLILYAIMRSFLFFAKYRKVINDDRVKLHLMKGSIPTLPISNHRTQILIDRITSDLRIFGKFQTEIVFK